MAWRRRQRGNPHVTGASARADRACKRGIRIPGLAVLAACLLLGSGEARALGLGGLELSSNLNQPLQAHIPLRSVEPGDLDDLRIGLASREQFRRAGLDRPVVLSRLRFEIVDGGNGESFIRVSTKEPVREPFLNFLLEANWPQGRVIREYTVLLDPPVYGAAISSGVQEAVTTASELPPLEESASQSTQPPEGGEDTQASRMVRSAPEARPEAADAAPESESAQTAAPAPEPGDMADRDAGAAQSMAAAPPEAGVEGAASERAADDAPQASEEPSAAPEPVAKLEGDRMPGGDSAATGFQPSPGLGTYEVQRGDTLWSLAERYRPQDSVSVQQTMLAILSANPEAFAEDNVNSLRAGAVLQMPELYDIALSKDDALAEVRRQNALWEEYRRAVTTQVAQAPEGLVDPGAGDDVTSGVVTSDDVTGDDLTADDVADDDVTGDDLSGGDMAADDALDEDVMQDPLVADALGPEAAAALEDEDMGRLQVLATGSALEQPEDTAKSGSERLQGLRNELNLTLEEMDAVRQQNEELRARLDQTHALVEDLKRLVELKDDNIAALQRRLGDLGQDPEVPERATPEPESALEEPAEPEVALDESAPEMSPPEQQEPAPTTADIPPPDPATGADEPTSTVATAEEASESGAPQTGDAQPASGEEPSAGENLAMGGEAPSGDETTPPSEEEAAAASPGGEGAPAAEDSVAGSSEVAGDADSSTETVAMVGETASPAGGSSGGSSSPKPSKPPAAPSFLESVLATLASFTGTAIEFGKSVGSVISSFIGSARESISLPALPTSLPSSLPVDPVMLGAAGGGVLLLGAGWMVMRRRRGGEAEAVEVELGIEDEIEEPLQAPDSAGSIGSHDDAPAVGEASFGDEATGIVAAEGDDDPLAEVNVYMAYERFDQAEALVRDAIERFPDRHEYKLKLLEVAHAAKNLEVFEDGARALQDAVGADSTFMQKAVSWWQELSPDRELFSERSGAAPAADVETEDGLTSDINRIFDVTGADAEVDSGAETQADERRSTNTDVDFDLGGDEDMAESGMDADEVSGSDLDFDLGSVDQDEATGDQDLDFSLSGGDEQPAPEAAAEIDDPTMQGESFSLDTHVGETNDAAGSSADAETGDDNSLDFDLSGIDLPQSGEGGSEAGAEGAGDDWSGGDDEGFDLDLDDNDTALGPVDSDEAAGQPSAGDESGDGSLDFELEETYMQGGGESLAAGLDESDGDASMALEAGAGEGDEGFDLSLDADGVETGEAEDQLDTVKLDDASFEGVGDDAPGGDDSDVSLDLSESDGLAGYDDLGASEESAGEQQSEEQGEGFDLDLSGFDMEGEGADDAAQASGAVAEAAPADDGEGEKTQFMLRDPGSGAAQGGSGVPFNEMSGDADAIQTKLDLALAYIDMGDSDGARSILDEVMVEGNDAQKKAAEDLLTKLD